MAIQDEPLKLWGKSPNHTLVTSFAHKNDTGATKHGVGVILRKDIKECAEQIESVIPEIMVLTFSGNSGTTSIACYSPTNISPEEEVAEFYSNLSDVISQIPPHNVVFGCGDFNAKLGLDSVRNSFHETNRNGEYPFNLL